jgi:AraC-like DNA-binding protein
MRCEHIKRVLVTSDDPIGKISEELDFSSEYYFNSYFKRNVGMPPGTYRKKFSES